MPLVRFCVDVGQVTIEHNPQQDGDGSQRLQKASAPCLRMSDVVFFRKKCFPSCRDKTTAGSVAAFHQPSANLGSAAFSAQDPESRRRDKTVVNRSK